MARAHSYVPSFVCSITFVQITAIVEEAISKDTPVRASNLLIICVKRAANGSDYSLVGEGKLSFKFTVCWFLSLLAGSHLTGTCYNFLKP